MRQDCMQSRQLLPIFAPQLHKNDLIKARQCSRLPISESSFHNKTGFRLSIRLRPIANRQFRCVYIALPEKMGCSRLCWQQTDKSLCPIYKNSTHRRHRWSAAAHTTCRQEPIRLLHNRLLPNRAFRQRPGPTTSRSPIWQVFPRFAAM